MKSIKDARIKNKIVLLRVDFNLPMENGNVLNTEDYRIRAVLPTIRYLLKNNNKLILVSHLGRPEGRKNKTYSLEPIIKHLEKLLRKKIVFIPDDIRKRNYDRNYIRNYDDGSKIFFLENIRFYSEEEKNSKRFAKKLASFADVFVNDAFSVCHRKHASVTSITEFLPSFAGLSLVKETGVLDRALKSPDHPLAVIIGGLKADTKVQVIGNFLPKTNYLMLGGVLANTILSAKGIAIGRSIVSPDIIPAIKKMRVADIRFHIPVDVVVSRDMDGKSGIRVTAAGNVRDDEIILDIGPDTVALFSEMIKKSKMVIWNGPVGKADTEIFSKGTRAIAKVAIKKGIYSIVGGGDTVAILHKMNLLNKFNHISTGGGAMLEYLGGNKLPGIEVLR